MVLGVSILRKLSLVKKICFLISVRYPFLKSGKANPLVIPRSCTIRFVMCFCFSKAQKVNSRKKLSKIWSYVQRESDQVSFKVHPHGTIEKVAKDQATLSRHLCKNTRMNGINQNWAKRHFKKKLQSK